MNLKHGAWGEIEKNNFTALPGEGGHSGFTSLKTSVPTQGNLERGFIAMVQGKIGVCGGPPGLGWSPDGLLWVSRLPSLWDGESFIK